jgi:hypothetical protein
MQEAFRRERFDLRLPHRDNANGIAHRVKDFQRITRFLAGTAWMVFDNGSHIPAPKPMLGQGGF